MKNISTTILTLFSAALLCGCQNLAASHPKRTSFAQPAPGLSKHLYACAYADVSTILAKYGRNYCGWTDGQDYSLGADSGRGVSSWRDHYNYVASSAVIPSNVVEFIAGRMSALQNSIKSHVSARVHRRHCCSVSACGTVVEREVFPQPDSYTGRAEKRF